MVDHMLGRLGRWMRILGYDAEYVSTGCEDDKVIELAAKRDAILVTRDSMLARRFHGSFLVRSTDIDEQIREFTSSFPPDLTLMMTRCTQCNGLLEHRNKSDLKGRLETGTWNSYEEFLVCSSCGRIYWKGPHYRNIIKKLRGILKLDEDTL